MQKSPRSPLGLFTDLKAKSTVCSQGLCLITKQYSTNAMLE
jgi:hypothetical protein